MGWWNMNDHLDGQPSKFSPGNDPAARIASLEFQCNQCAASVKSLRQELHDGLSQQVVGVAMMAAHLANTLKVAGAGQSGKAEQLVAAIEDAKRQTFALAERLKQMESELQG
jgi:hypothetical protein